MTWKVGDFAIGRWSQDDTWYNVEIMEKKAGEKFLVNFCDYGNQEAVEPYDLVLSSKHIPDGSCVDLNVNQEEELLEESSPVRLEEKDQDTGHVVQDGFDLSGLVKQGQDHPNIEVTRNLLIRTIQEPIGMTVLDDESILVCFRHGIARFDQDGQVLNCDMDFNYPTSVLKLADGKVVVVDFFGLHLLDSSLKMIKMMIASVKKMEFSSVAENEEGNILILRNKVSSPDDGDRVRASILIINRNAVVKQVICLEDLILGAMEEQGVSDSLASDCTNLTYKDGRIYVTGEP